MDFTESDEEVPSQVIPYSYKNIVDEDDIFVRAAAEESIDLIEPEETINLTETVEGSAEKKKPKKKQKHEIMDNNEDIEFFSTMDISPKTKEALHNFLVSFKNK